ncbi:MAG: HD domain-containing protein [Deltaproteobacteria bacterium]|nr:HD domain-containing protein [Deltaproteobacteria bacterium]
MVRKSLITKIFEAFSIQRWNDQIRPVPLVEMDKHGHKMFITYCLARYEEDAGTRVHWPNLIRGGVYELLRRVVLTDIKSPIYRRIRSQHRDQFIELSRWVCDQLDPLTDNETRAEMRAHLVDDRVIDETSRRILEAAHAYASFWEFQILKQVHPNGQHVARIEREMYNDIEPHLALTGMRKMMSRCDVAQFIDLVGQLRFQVRWGQTLRVPSTSVLGHSMMVATLMFFFSRDLPDCCERRMRNNFFGGLFHDLPECLTRDIISPVKGAAKDLPNVIQEIERELVQKEILPLVETLWRPELMYFMEDEFTSKIRTDGAPKPSTSDEINASYNSDEFDPVDGQLIKAADHLAAYVEAYTSSAMGFRTPHVINGMQGLREAWVGKTLGGIDIGAIYADFGN